MDSGIIYIFKNIINGKCYVGKTSRSLKRRLIEHKTNSKKENPTSLLYKALQKYSWESFDICILEKNINIDKLDDREIFYIKQYNSYFENNGYNLTLGGDGGRMTTESILRGIETKRKNGTINHTIESIQKISKTMTGVKKTKTHRENISKGRQGIIFSDETKKKMSDAGIGRVPWNKNKSGLTKGINSKPVIINDVKYQSAVEASEVLGISIHTVRYRIKSKTFTEWKKYG
jgi:group I intron endonuclease